MLLTKNNQLDKTGAWLGALSNFFGNAFIFSKTDALWRKKRKTTAHAFYKDRLLVMLEILKRRVLEV